MCSCSWCGSLSSFRCSWCSSCASCSSCSSCVISCRKCSISSAHLPCLVALQTRPGDVRYRTHPAARAGNWDTPMVIFSSAFSSSCSSWMEWLLISWWTASVRLHYTHTHTQKNIHADHCKFVIQGFFLRNNSHVSLINFYKTAAAKGF